MLCYSSLLPRLSVQLLTPQLYNYRIIVQLSEITLIDFCIAPIIAVGLVGERAKRARHSQVCSIENRGLLANCIVRANFVLITRKVGGA